MLQCGRRHRQEHNKERSDNLLGRRARRRSDGWGRGWCALGFERQFELIEICAVDTKCAVAPVDSGKKCAVVVSGPDHQLVRRLVVGRSREADHEFWLLKALLSGRGSDPVHSIQV